MTMFWSSPTVVTASVSFLSARPTATLCSARVKANILRILTLDKAIALTEPVLPSSTRVPVPSDTRPMSRLGTWGRSVTCPAIPIALEVVVSTCVF